VDGSDSEFVYIRSSLKKLILTNSPSEPSTCPKALTALIEPCASSESGPEIHDRVRVPEMVGGGARLGMRRLPTTLQTSARKVLPTKHYLCVSDLGIFAFPMRPCDGTVPRLWCIPIDEIVFVRTLTAESNRAIHIDYCLVLAVTPAFAPRYVCCSCL
jgi:hypothetical protein